MVRVHGQSKERKRRGSKSEAVVEDQPHGKRYGKSKRRERDVRKHGNSSMAKTTITLSEKNITGKEIAHYLKPLFWEQASNITHLNLSTNQIDYYGAVQMGNILKTNQTLVEIDLSYNNLDDRSLKIITRSILSEIDSLRVIDLSWNGITGEKSIEELAEMFEFDGNDSLTTINLSHNSISNAELITRLIISVLSSPISVLETINLSNNPFILNREHVMKLIGTVQELDDNRNERIKNIVIDAKQGDKMWRVFVDQLNGIPSTIQVSTVPSDDDEWEDEEEEDVPDLDDFLRKNNLKIIK